MKIPYFHLKRGTVLLCAMVLTAAGPATSGAAIPWSDLLAFWDFNDASRTNVAVDKLGGHSGSTVGAVAYTADAGGRTGAVGDRGMDFGTVVANQMLMVPDGTFLNQGASKDQLTLSFWQKLHSAGNLTAFHGVSPSSTGTFRGATAHVPWTDTIYFDTAGCCTADSQRMSQQVNATTWPAYTPTFWTAWHHFVFVKNGQTKQVYIDGQLFQDGLGTDPLPQDFTSFVIGNFAHGTAGTTGIMDDFMVFAAGLDAAQVAELFALTASPLAADTDSDGMPDLYEDAHGLAKADPTDATKDADGDSLNNLKEYQVGTDPKKTDTDNDGLNDAVETWTGTFVSATDTGTSPVFADTDGDTLKDGVETGTGVFVSATNTGSNPNQADTDGDSYSDSIEVSLGSNPNDASSIPYSPGKANLLAYWNFNNAGNPAQAISHNGFVGTLSGDAVYTEDAGGWTGQAGDRAVDYSANTGARVTVAGAPFLNVAAQNDKLAFSFRLKLYEIAQANAFWASSTSTAEGRGAQAHVPWNNNIVYFDTAGCCDPPQRMNAPISSFPDYVDDSFWLGWHHFVFQKDGDVKQIWIDGKLFLQSSGAAPLPQDFYELIIGGGSSGSIRGFIDDFAVFGNGLKEYQVKALAQGTSPASLDNDTDGDGIPDVAEDAYGLNKNDAADAQQDSDNDGLTNLVEYQKALDPKNPDSDNDGLKDGVETGTGTWVSTTDTGTNPLLADTDSDGLKDGVETATGTYVSPSDTGTNPLIADSDTDGFSDGVEVEGGSSPVDSKSIPIKEYGANLMAFWNFNDASNPKLARDTVKNNPGVLEASAAFTEAGGGRTGQGSDRAVDFGLAIPSDMAAVRVTNALFLNQAAVRDRITVSAWMKLSELFNGALFFGVSPSSASGGRGIAAFPWSNNEIYFDTFGADRVGASITTFPDYLDDTFWMTWHHYAFVKNGTLKQIWIDGKLFAEGRNPNPLPSDFTQLLLGQDPPDNTSIHGMVDDFAVFASALDSSFIQALAQGALPTELDKDTDQDGAPDIWEDAYALKKNDASDGSLDPDADGLTNLLEYQKGTHPNNPDTDGDTLKDGVETGTGIWVSATNTGTSPTSTDSDGDSLRDNFETGTGTYTSPTNTGTDPNKSDTDGDTFPDGAEVFLATNPNSASSSPAGRVNLLAYWSFNTDTDPNTAVDKVHNIPGNVELGAFYTADAGGFSGKPGDKAMDFGMGGTRVDVTNATFLNYAGAMDQMTVVFWQKLAEVAQSSPFWAVSPAVGGRGFQVHTPWDDNNIYFDTSGCCDGTRQRISRGITAFPGYTGDPAWWNSWHHFAFSKNGPIKQVWIDGQLFLEGQNTAPLPTDFNELIIGADANTTPASIHGVLDDFAVYASALSERNIALLAAGAAPDQLIDPPSISCRLEGANVVVTFTGTLQSSDDADGPFTDVTGSSPMTFPTTSAMKFFRSRD